VASINHDIDDAIRAGMLSTDDLPVDEIAVLGATGSRRIDTLVHDLVESSAQTGDIVQSDEIGGAMLSLRAFMFDRVYLGPQSREEHLRIRTTIRRIFEHLVERGDDATEATDYLAGMTDRVALSVVARREQGVFVGALERLGKRVGVELEYEERSPEAARERRRKERLGQVLERAASFYERVLRESEQGAFARDYLASRGLGD